MNACGFVLAQFKNPTGTRREIKARSRQMRQITSRHGQQFQNSTPYAIIMKPRRESCNLERCEFYGIKRNICDKSVKRAWQQIVQSLGKKVPGVEIW
jgi:hypothetical protein